MTNYREILRLKSLGLNPSQIAESAAISRPTVISVLQKAAETGISYQRATELSDKEEKVAVSDRGKENQLQNA
jgi:DNA-binding transcriptional regulator LsrR (DeoR family)